MADIYERTARLRLKRAERPSPPASGGGQQEADPLWFIEALFLAYREFIREPDRILSEIGFGRAHHRALYFVHRYPGMRVADLLEILQITKQSLARVLRELVKEGYIQRRSGETDRRERLLYPTERGQALALRLTELQIGKVQAALAAVGDDGAAAVAAFLRHMAPDAVRPAVLRRGQLAQEASEEG
jgi:DNA-binding MarR family transcriptional regulator